MWSQLVRIRDVGSWNILTLLCILKFPQAWRKKNVPMQSWSSFGFQLSSGWLWHNGFQMLNFRQWLTHAHTHTHNPSAPQAQTLSQTTTDGGDWQHEKERHYQLPNSFLLDLTSLPGVFLGVRSWDDVPCLWQSWRSPAHCTSSTVCSNIISSAMGLQTGSGSGLQRCSSVIRVAG